MVIGVEVEVVAMEGGTDAESRAVANAQAKLYINGVLGKLENWGSRLIWGTNGIKFILFTYCFDVILVILLYCSC